VQEELSAFLAQIPDLKGKTPAELIHYFVYFLTVVKEQAAASVGDVTNCFGVARVAKYSNVRAYLSNHSRSIGGRRPQFIKVKSGYQLERNHEAELGATLQTGPARTQAADALNGLLSDLTDRDEKAFLQEAIDCYRIDARRASIVLVWILTLHHLFQYVLKHKLAAFNVELAKVTDKRVKVKSVATVDDFGDIPESILIGLLRSAGVISNDVRKILDVKLGIRNTSAHPSAVLISQVKTTDFIIDLIQNVILKYKL
jgi:hypothetical protein